MKKIILIIFVIPIFSGSKNFKNFTTQKIENFDLIQDTLKPELNQDTLKISIDSDLRKKTDSMLTVAEENNLQASRKLDEVKKLQEKDKQLDIQLENLRKELKTNIKYTVKMLKERQQKIKNLNNIRNNNIQKGNNIALEPEIKEPKIDSLYQKGSLFKKGRWIYHIEIDGKHYELIK